MMDIQYFETSRINGVNLRETIENIENKGAQSERKMHEKFRDNRDICMYNENRGYLEECTKDISTYARRKE
jgi:hypothetical protein